MKRGSGGRARSAAAWKQGKVLGRPENPEETQEYLRTPRHGETGRDKGKGPTERKKGAAPGGNQENSAQKKALAAFPGKHRNGESRGSGVQNAHEESEV